MVQTRTTQDANKIVNVDIKTGQPIVEKTGTTSYEEFMQKGKETVRNIRYSRSRSNKS